MNRNDAILAASFGAALAAVVLIELIARYCGSEVVAAWVQAIGTILAVLAAIVIASSQSRTAACVARAAALLNEERDRKVAYLLVMRLASLLGDVEIKLNLAHKTATHLPNLRIQAVEDVDAILDALLLNVTWDESIFARFDLLPTKAAQHVSHLLYSAKRFDRETDIAIRFSVKHSASWAQLSTKLVGNVSNMLHDLNVSKLELRPVLDAAPPDA